MYPSEIPEPNFGCVVNPGCFMNESIVRLLIGAIVGLGDFTADMIVNALDQEVSTSQWNIAIGQWGVWAALMMMPVATVMIYQVGMGLLMQDRKRIQSAVLGGAVAVPLAAVAVFMMVEVTKMVDASSMTLVSSIQSGKIGSGILRGLGLGATDADLGDIKEGTAVHEAAMAAIAARAAGALVPTLLVMLLMMVASLLLMVAMVFRTYGLLILAAMAPLAFMMIGQGKLTAWAEKWISLVVGLLLMKPIVSGILALMVNLQLADDSSFIKIVVGAMMIFLCAFAPFWCVKLVDIAGNEIGAAWSARPSAREGMGRAKSATSGVARAARGVAQAPARVSQGVQRAATSVKSGFSRMMTMIRR